MGCPDVGAARFSSPSDLPLDRAALLRRMCGDESDVREILEITRRTCPTLLDDVRKTLHEREPAALARAAHALRGALLVAAAPPHTAQLAQELEAAACRADLSGCDRALEMLANKVELFLRALDDDLTIHSTA